tara:strand:+ start:2117 stop:2422 length:306 start_codon:yes stop_codon:yes gene_type:complete
MKILLPSVTAHEIDLIPRVYPTTALVLSLYNESTKVTTTPANTYVILNGILTISFTATVAEGSKYQIEITENSIVVFRGKVLVTSQTSQEYKLTNGLYFYS